MPSAFYEKQKAIYDLFDNRRSRDDSERAVANLQNAIAGASFNEPMTPSRNGSTLQDFLPKNNFGAVTPNFKFVSPATQDQSTPTLEKPKNHLSAQELEAIANGSDKYTPENFNMYERMSKYAEALGIPMESFMNPKTAYDWGYRVNSDEKLKTPTQKFDYTKGSSKGITEDHKNTLIAIRDNLVNERGISSPLAAAMASHFYREHGNENFSKLWNTSYNGDHEDAANKARNRGAISYQGDRGKDYDADYDAWAFGNDGRSKMDFELDHFFKDLQKYHPKIYKKMLELNQSGKGTYDDYMHLLDISIGWVGSPYHQHKVRDAKWINDGRNKMSRAYKLLGV